MDRRQFLKLVALTGAAPYAAHAAGPLRVAVFGDSLSDGLWSGLRYDLRDDASLDFVRLGKVSSGLTRDGFYDWQARAKSIAAEGFSCGICQIGLNDQQHFDVGDGEIGWGTAEWAPEYRRRAKSIADTFAAHSVPLVWVGLPTVRDKELLPGVELINGIIQSVAAESGNLYISIWAETSDAHGRFSAFLSDGGSMRDLRADDGEHMTGEGYRMVARFVIDGLKSSDKTNFLFA
jgi:hypothetical protein